MKANFDIFNSIEIINLEDSSLDTHEEQQFDINDTYEESFDNSAVSEIERPGLCYIENAHLFLVTKNFYY